MSAAVAVYQVLSFGLIVSLIGCTDASSVDSGAVEPPRPGKILAVVEVPLPDDAEGLLVAEVGAGGPAAAAGFQPGDSIVSVDGETVPADKADRISWFRSRLLAGVAREITVIRAKEQIELVVVPQPAKDPMAVREARDSVLRLLLSEPRGTFFRGEEGSIAFRNSRVDEPVPISDDVAAALAELSPLRSVFERLETRSSVTVRVVWFEDFQGYSIEPVSE